MHVNMKTHTDAFRELISNGNVFNGPPLSYLFRAENEHVWRKWDCVCVEERERFDCTLTVGF